MANVISLKEYEWHKRFTEEVTPFFDHLHLPYQPFRYQSEAVCVLKTHVYAFIFLTYIDKNKPTTLPNIADRFRDIKTNPRQSNGEWVVEHVYEVDEKYTHKLLQQLAHYEGDPQGIVALKQNLVQLKNEFSS